MEKQKRLGKIVLSGLLALAMTISGMSGTPADAKAKKAVLKTKTVKLKVGKSRKITIKNKKKSCKYTFKSNKKRLPPYLKKERSKPKRRVRQKSQ